VCVAVIVVLCARTPDKEQQVIIDSSGQIRL